MHPLLLHQHLYHLTLPQDLPSQICLCKMPLNNLPWILDNPLPNLQVPLREAEDLEELAFWREASTSTSINLQLKILTHPLMMTFETTLIKNSRNR
jgi:hypothetical protein